MRTSLDVSSSDPAPDPPRGALVRFLGKRLLLVVVLGSLLFLTLLIWGFSSRLSEVEEQTLNIGLEHVVDGMFLGKPIRDQTHDQFVQNPWLRIAMNEGFRASTVFRRHQIESISLVDGQHAESGERAVIVILVPRDLEIPDPPLTPVAVRRWRPEPGTVYENKVLEEKQKKTPPNVDDLQELREVFSGGRFEEIGNLYDSLDSMVLIVAIGLGCILLAAIYKVTTG